MKSLGVATTALFAMSLTACGLILGLQEPTVDDSIEGGADGAPNGDSPNNGDVIKQGDAPVDSACGANLQTDGANCGTCGHDCLGGTCSGGACQPVIVTQSTSIGPYAMVLDGTTLYFTNTRGNTLESVFKIDKGSTNGTATELVDYSTGYTTPVVDALPLDVAVQGNFFYTSLYSDSGLGNDWQGGVDRCPVTGCTTKTLADYGIDSYAVVANSSNVFFSSADTNDVYKVMKAALDMTGATAIGTPASEVNGLALDGADLYYATEDGVFHCTSTACNDATSIVQGQSLDAELMTLDSSNVYFTSTPFQGTATIQSIPRAGGPPKLISQKPALPFGVATDGTNIYFTDVGDTSNTSSGAVYMCPVAGCNGAEVVLSNGPAAGNNPRPIVNDTNAIYWGTRSGTIWRLAK